MAKSIKGSAFYDDNGGCIFTPYETGKAENITWLLLKEVKFGKLECSKNKVRVTLSVERGDIGAVCSQFTLAIGQLIAAFMNNKHIKYMYEKAKDMKPCEIDAETEPLPEDDEIPTFG